LAWWCSTLPPATKEGVFEAAIHQGAWKVNSAYFAITEFYEVRASTALLQRFRFL